MKILILHVANTFNYGTMMMAQNLINTLKDSTEQEISFYTDIKDDDNMNRLKEATGIEKIYFDEKMNLHEKGNSKIRKIREILNIRKHAKEVSDFYDKIIFLGGDDFSELYAKNIKEKFLIFVELTKIKYLNYEKKVVLLGQTIGPYTGIRKFYAKKIFRNVNIITRDQISHDTMKNEYNVGSKVSKDLAFIDLQFQNDYIAKADEILEEYGIKKDQYITIVGTQLIRLYTKDEKDFINSFIKIIEKVKKSFPNKKIVWLSHVTTRPPARNDNFLLDKINTECNNYINENMIVIREEMLPIKARIILGNGYLTISCRMHAAVSTFQMGKPAIALSYSPKYYGVIGQGLEMENLIIEAKKDSIWKENIDELVEQKIDYIKENYDELATKIKENVNKCKNIAKKDIKSILTK